MRIMTWHKHSLPYRKTNASTGLQFACTRRSTFMRFPAFSAVPHECVCMGTWRRILVLCWCSKSLILSRLSSSWCTSRCSIKGREGGREAEKREEREREIERARALSIMVPVVCVCMAGTGRVWSCSSHYGLSIGMLLAEFWHNVRE